MLTVGLTGNYGMGKSTVSAMFRKLGAVVIDSDLIVAKILKDNTVIKKIARLLGQEVIERTGELNKKIIAEKIFSDSILRKRIEKLIHPLVFKAIETEIKNIKQGLIIVEIPLLFESNYKNRFDHTITVWTKRSTALSRLNAKGISARQADARMHAQMDIRTKKRLADYTIDNNGSKEKTWLQVMGVYSLLQQADTNKDQRRS